MRRCPASNRVRGGSKMGPRGRAGARPPGLGLQGLPLGSIRPPWSVVVVGVGGGEEGVVVVPLGSINPPCAAQRLTSQRQADASRLSLSRRLPPGRLAPAPDRVRV